MDSAGPVGDPGAGGLGAGRRGGRGQVTRSQTETAIWAQPCRQAGVRKGRMWSARHVQWPLWLRVGDHGHRGAEAGRVTADPGGGGTREVHWTAPHGDRHPSAGRLAGGGGASSKWLLWARGPCPHWPAGAPSRARRRWGRPRPGGSEPRPAPGAPRSHTCLPHCPEHAAPSCRQKAPSPRTW